MGEKDTKNNRKNKCAEQTTFTRRPCRANGVDDPAFFPPHWVVIISNDNVGVLTVHKMNYLSFSLQWTLWATAC